MSNSFSKPMEGAPDLLERGYISAMYGLSKNFVSVYDKSPKNIEAIRECIFLFEETIASYLNSLPVASDDPDDYDKSGSDADDEDDEDAIEPQTPMEDDIDVETFPPKKRPKISKPIKIQ